MTWIAGGLIVVAAVVGLLALLAPRRISYTEAVEVDAPVDQVYDNVRFQERLMQWSAWPAATGAACQLDVSRAQHRRDGEVGARTVFLTKGKPSGHQEVLSLSPSSSVVLHLESVGPPHRPRLAFRFEPLGPSRSRVTLDFSNEFPRPFNALWRFAGLSAWTRRLHVKDLEGLKAFTERSSLAEPPPASRAPTVAVPS